MLGLKQMIKKVFNYLGYNITTVNEDMPKQRQILINPFADYIPWQSDSNFLKTYDIIKDYTLVDIYRCFELWQLVSQSLKVGGGLIEIGVWRGGTGGLVCKRVELEKCDNMVYLADTFKGVVKASGIDSFYKGGEHSDTSISIVNKLLIESLHLSNYKLLEGIFPEETSHLVSDNSFCFCHIDVDVYNSAKDIVDWIWPKLKVGGMIVYDDYGFLACSGVTKFVNEGVDKDDRILIYNLNGHGIVIKIK